MTLVVVSLKEFLMQPIKVAPSTIILFCVLGLVSSQTAFSQTVGGQERVSWTDSFETDKCQFSSTGENKYFILKPDYRLLYEGIEGRDTTRLVITVLNEIQLIGKVETRVVEEKESVNGRVVEVSRNFFAVCTQTNSIFYFGEDVDIYKNDKIASHGGAWRAGEGGAKAGVMMPGIILLGSRFYQEVAPEVAMDRAEIISMNETIQTPAGKFQNCLKTEETTPLEPKNKEYKLYSPGVGLVRDGDLLLTSYGFR
jgi:hypothetical protein